MEWKGLCGLGLGEGVSVGVHVAAAKHHSLRAASGGTRAVPPANADHSLLEPALKKTDTIPND